MATESGAKTLDVREITPRDRHPLIFNTVDELGAGESFVLVNDHDPKPLRFQLDAERPGLVEWDYLERGPEVWRVRITRTGAGHATGATGARTVSPILTQSRLAEEIARFAPGDDASGRRAEALVKTDGLRVVLVTLREGAGLQEHVAPGPITIQALSGRIVVSVDGAGDRRLDAGDLIAISTGVRHAVHAETAGAFLLTIAWGSGATARLPFAE